MKRCNKCGETKLLSDFYKMAGMRDGYRNDCKACSLRAKKERYDADPATSIARVKRWQQANIDRVNAVQRRRRSDPAVKLQMREYQLKRKYGLTLEQYDAMLLEQGGGCGICGKRPRPDISLHVDHDHSTGRSGGSCVSLATMPWVISRMMPLCFGTPSPMSTGRLSTS